MRWEAGTFARKKLRRERKIAGASPHRRRIPGRTSYGDSWFRAIAGFTHGRNTLQSRPTVLDMAFQLFVLDLALTSSKIQHRAMCGTVEAKLHVDLNANHRRRGHHGERARHDLGHAPPM